jgi:DMSO/TMAO reductase YedYZ molybdopterin-dependent catalytic subunit
MANALLAHVSNLARPAALLGALALVMLVSGAAGALFALPGSSLAGRLLGGMLAAALLVATLFRTLPPASDESAALLSLCLVIGILLESTAPSAHTGRRSFLVRSGVVLLGAAALLGEFSVGRLFGAVSPRRLFAFRRPSGLTVDGISDLVTPTYDFYVMDKVLEYPAIDLRTWRLRIDGAVGRPMELSLGDLMARQSISRYITMECIDNPVGGSLVSNALWTGIPISELLQEVGARGRAVVFDATDQYAESVPRFVAERAGGLVAFGMNGETLPAAHGFPARFVLPGRYGFKSVKWLTRIRVLDSTTGGNWQAQGWSEEGRIHTMVRIDVARRRGGTVLLAGIAFAGDRGIRAVEVRANGGPWVTSTLGPSLSRASWVQWAVRIVGHSPATIEARAIDGEGHIQEHGRHGSYPNGSTGWASITV